MSLHVHDCLNKRREFGRAITYRKQLSYDEQIYSDKHFMDLMTLERELPGHSGCINTLDWSPAGDKLLSGSDDTKLNIYQPFEDYELSHSISTGHRANIFTAKFMPQTSDSVLISGAGDSEIRIFDLNDPSSSDLESMYVCHSDQLKKICTFDDNPFEFLTCSQDGTVRHFDRRIPHLCSPHNVRSFITEERKPAKQYPLPKVNANLKHGCPPPIVDYSKYKIGLNSMTINALFPYYFAVAGMDSYIYLHDRRMLPSRYSQPLSSNNNIMESLKCVKRFSPVLNNLGRFSKHITACQFSTYNSYELIGSWSSDGIYLFNIHDSSTRLDTPQSMVPKNKFVHTEPYEHNESDQKKFLWCKIFDHLHGNNNNVEQAYSTTNNLLHYLTHHTTPSFDTTLGKVCCYMMQATIQSYQGNVEAVQKSLQAATRTAETMEEETWQQFWALAVGYWMMVRPVSDEKPAFDKAFENLTEAKATYLMSTQQSSAFFSQLHRTYMDIMHTFSESLKETFAREGYGPASPSMQPKTTQQQQQWGLLMYVTLFSPDEARRIAGIEEETHTSADECEDSDTSSSTFSGEHQRAPMTDTDMSLFARIMSREIVDIYRRGGLGEDSDDSDLDFEELVTFREDYQYPSQTFIGMVRPRAKYEGHGNIETIKDVGFFGPQDEYIVSGSDGGHLFIWDKKTCKVVQILQADQEIVNVAKGHPSLPILAVSGIDSTTKIFTPTSRPATTSKVTEPKNLSSYSTSSRMYEEDEIVRTNAENNSSMESDIISTGDAIEILSRLSSFNS